LPGRCSFFFAITGFHPSTVSFRNISVKPQVLYAIYKKKPASARHPAALNLAENSPFRMENGFSYFINRLETIQHHYAALRREG
jgi:hypothetical protein